MIRNIAQITFKTHAVHVSRDDDTGELVLFKYDRSACDFNVFQDELEASDWILEPIPHIVYRVVVSGEESE